MRATLSCLSLAVLMAGSLVVAQTAGGPMVVPIEQEPQHRRVFRNDVIAVLDVQFPPGYTSLFHRHSNDNVSVRIATAPTRTDTLTETGTPQTAAVGRLVFNSASPPYVHRVTNLGDTTIRILDIEVLARPGTRRASTTDDLTGHDVVLENDRVRLSRIVAAAGATVAAHGHPAGWLEVTVRGAVPGSYRWHDAGDRVSALVAPSGGLDIAEIEVK